MNNTSLAVTNGNHLQAYGQRAEIEEISSRLMEFHPNAQKLGPQTMKSIAQLAIMSGANPMPTSGEIQAWPNWDGSITIMLGIPYYRRKAKEIDKVNWVDGPRKATKAEREGAGVYDPNAIVSIATGYRVSEFLELVKVGIPWKEAERMIARTGTAVVGYYGEQVYPKDVPSKHIKRGDPIQPPKAQSWQIVCNKRAEQALYKMLSLVDTTLTDYINSSNKAMADMGLRQREYPQTDMSHALGNMDLDEFNGLLFGEEETIIFSGEEVDQSPADERQAGHEAYWQGLADLRASLEESAAHTLGDVAQTAVATGFYTHEQHALNAIKKFNFPVPVTVTREQKVSRDGALQIFDWLVERKMGEEK